MLARIGRIFSNCCPLYSSHTESTITPARLPIKYIDLQNPGLKCEEKVAIILQGALLGEPISELLLLIPYINNCHRYAPPATLNELLNFSNWRIELAHCLEYFLKMAWESSPFFQAHNGHASHIIYIENGDALHYKYVLEAFGSIMNEINAKFKEETQTTSKNNKINIATPNLIRPRLHGGSITCSRDGVCPPLNFSYFDLDNIDFHNLPFTSCDNHFDHACLVNCAFKGGKLHASAWEKAKLQGKTFPDKEVEIIYKKIEIPQHETIAITRL